MSIYLYIHVYVCRNIRRGLRCSPELWRGDDQELQISAMPSGGSGKNMAAYATTTKSRFAKVVFLSIAILREP